ncbi:MAG: gliding motility-associated C-terminal domain-containing protein [Chitinophagales bacterium]|nr:gliding motility-associated C-terminal domain-containing protein [Chitinophagales bacterium]
MNLNTISCMYRLLALGLFCFVFGPAAAQLSKHGNIWYFGAGSGLDFSSGSPTVLSNINVDTYEGCAGYCDAGGKMLFYTNGGGFVPNGINGPREGIIWNANQAVMYNMGDDKGGGYSAAQGAVIVPHPGNPRQYFLFTIDHNLSVITPPLGTHRGLSYFVVDMTLNGGLGGVIEADKRLFTPATEAITAVRHSNGKDFWIICSSYTTQQFVVTPLTAAGPGAPFVQPRLATALAPNVIKAAPDGKLIFDGTNLYNFDAATGSITLKATLGLSTYSHTFSPSSRYLLAFRDDSGFSNILRYDLSLPNLADQVPKVIGNMELSFNGLMQLGPDGNVYLNEQTEFNILTLTQGISRITCPDGIAPRIQRNLFDLPVDINNAGGLYTSLPNFADYIFAAQNSQTDTTRLTICDTLNGILLQSAKTGVVYRWDNGATTDTLRVHQAGIYTLEITDSCGVSFSRFEIASDNAELDITANIADSCNLFPLTLRALTTGTGTLSWLNGSSASDSLRADKEGIYVATFQTSCRTLRDSFEVKLSEKCCKFPDQVPNAFTPNGDNINDRFSPVLGACELEVLELRIYARWGELVFQGFNNTETWDGLTLNGTDAVGDVYAYTLEYRLPNEQQVRLLKGEVTLIR